MLAVELIGRLVEQYGQFGSGVPTRDHTQGGYDNSFLIADQNEAWVLEAVGTRWAARRVSHTHASISNQPSIRTAWDRGSSDLAAHAAEQGWWPEDRQGSFDFARAYIDPDVARQLSHIRAMRSGQLLAEQNGRVTVEWMMRIARDHYEDTFLHGPYFDAADPDFLSLCMHVSPRNLPGATRPVPASPPCRTVASSCRSSGGRPARHAMAVMCRFSYTAARCQKPYPRPEPSASVWLLPIKRAKTNSRLTHTGGCFGG